MLAPLSWLKEYVDIDIPAKELEKKLFSAGFESFAGISAAFQSFRTRSCAQSF